MEKNDRMKTIKKWLFVAIIFVLILLFASQKQASALVYKDRFYSTYQGGNDRTGTINTGTQSEQITFTFDATDTNGANNYDLTGLQILNLSVRGVDMSNSANTTCYPSNVNGMVQYRCESGEFLQYYGNSVYWNLTGIAFYSDNTQSQCWLSSEVNDVILCPNYKNNPIRSIYVRISTGQTLSKIYYHLNVSGYKLYYNYDSTEIINSNGVIVNQQQQTNSILSGTDTTGATTNGTSLFGSAQTELNTGLENTTGEANLVTIVQTFFTQIDNSTCQPIQLPIPFTNETLVLPCIGTELQTRVPLLWTLYTTIITGVLVFRFWNFAIDMIKHLVDPYSTGLSGVSDISGGGK